MTLQVSQQGKCPDAPTSTNSHLRRLLGEWVGREREDVQRAQQDHTSINIEQFGDERLTITLEAAVDGVAHGDESPKACHLPIDLTMLFQIYALRLVICWHVILAFVPDGHPIMRAHLHYTQNMPLQESKQGTWGYHHPLFPQCTYIRNHITLLPTPLNQFPQFRGTPCTPQTNMEPHMHPF